MRVVCDNCGATYRIPEEKLRREVNKATCRKCQNPIIIRRTGGMAIGAGDEEEDPDASTQISELAALQEKAHEDAGFASQGQGMGLQFQPAMGVDEEPVNPTVASSDVLRQARIAEPTIPRPGMGSPAAIEPEEGPPPPPPATGAPPPLASAPPLPPPPLVPDLPPPVMLPKHGDPRSPMHSMVDPSSDLSVVMMANFAAVFGVLLLAIATQDWQRYGGLLVTLWGVTSSLMVVITSDRGRRQGQVILSLFVGLLVSGVLSWGFYWSNMNLGGPPVVEQPPPPPAVAPAPDPVEDAVAGEDATGEDPADDVPGDDAPTAAAGGDAVVSAPAKKESVTNFPRPGSTGNSSRPASSSSSGSRGSTGGSSSSRSYPSGSGTSVARSSSSWDDEPAAPASRRNDDDDFRSSGSSSANREPTQREPTQRTSSSTGSTGVPLTVLDTMLRSNRGVKGCFVQYRNATGSLPSGRIPVKIRIQPTGSPDRVYISSGTYRDTSLDDCLSRAIRDIQFPPFDGDAKNYTYPFTL